MQENNLRFENWEKGIVVTGYFGYPETLVVPSEIFGERVIGIKASAFEGLQTLNSLIVEGGIVFIGENSFKNCVNLESIEIPQSVLHIGKDAFYNTHYFNYHSRIGGLLYIGNHLIDCEKDVCGKIGVNGCFVIAEGAFEDCSNIDEIVIFKGVTHINARAFLNCSLKKVTLPDGVIEVGDEAFCNAVNLEQINFSQSIKFIGADSLENTKIQNIHLEKGLPLVISNYLIRFKGRGKINIDNYFGIAVGALCESEITEVSGKNVTKLPPICFYMAEKLVSVNLPNVNQVGDGAFACCKSLKYVNISASADVGKNSFYKAGNLSKNSPTDKDIILYNRLVAISQTVYGEYKVPYGVTHIGKKVFCANKQLSNIYLSNTVKQIGEKLAYGCTFLKKIILSNRIKVIPAKAFADCISLEKVEGLNATVIQESAFENCVLLTTINLPQALKYIGDMAFAGDRNLELVELPSSLQYIGEMSFYGCASVDFDLPVSLEQIGKSAFEGARRLKVINVLSASVIPENCFKGCIALKTVTLSSQVKLVSQGAFTNCTALLNVKAEGSPRYAAAFENCSRLEAIEIFPANKVIESQTFKNCTSLKKVVLYNGVEKIYDQAFYGTSELKEIYFPDSIYYIGKECFCESALEEVTLNDYTSLAFGAFKNCKNLTKINRKSAVFKNAVIGENAFAGCSNLHTANLPACYKVLTSAFEGLENLQVATLPDGVQVIADKVFYGCPISKLVIPKSTVKYGKDVLTGALIFKENLIKTLKEERGLLLKLGGNTVIYKIKGTTYKLKLPLFDDSCFSNPNWLKGSLKDFDSLFADSEAMDVKSEYVKYRLLYPYDLSANNKKLFLTTYFKDIAKNSVISQNADELITFAKYEYFTRSDLQELLEISSTKGSIRITATLLNIIRDLPQ